MLSSANFAHGCFHTISKANHAKQWGGSRGTGRAKEEAGACQSGRAGDPPLAALLSAFKWQKPSKGLTHCPWTARSGTIVHEQQTSSGSSNSDRSRMSILILIENWNFNVNTHRKCRSWKRPPVVTFMTSGTIMSRSMQSSPGLRNASKHFTTLHRLDCAIGNEWSSEALLSHSEVPKGCLRGALRHPFGTLNGLAGPQKCLRGATEVP